MKGSTRYYPGFGAPDLATSTQTITGTDATKAVSPATAAEIGIRPWVTGATYRPGQKVMESGRLYRCLLPHVAGASFPVDLAAARWAIIQGGAGGADGQVQFHGGAASGNASEGDAGLIYNSVSNTLTATELFITGPFRYASPVNTTGLTVDVNDWAPFGAANLVGAVWTIASNANGRTITGITAASADGYTLTLINTGTFTVVLAGSSASSVAANRFGWTGNYTINPGEGIDLIYSTVTSRWTSRGLVSAGASAAGATGNLQYRDAAGALAAEAALTYDSATDVLTVPSAVVTAALTTTGVITPTALAANTNDYNPAGLATAAVVRISASGAFQLTGLTAQTGGRRLTLVNVGTQTITLLNASTSSAAANRFAMAQDTALRAGDAAEFFYDGILARWVLLSPIPVAGAAAAAGATNQIQYNNAGALAAEAAFAYDPATDTMSVVNIAESGGTLWGLNATPSPPSGNQVREWVGDLGGRSALQWMGSDGLAHVVQPLLGHNMVGLWYPPGNATTVPGVFGLTAPTTTGTATARNFATTNFFTRQRRIGFVSAATAASLGGTRITVANITTGSGTLGGFYLVIRFGASDAATVAGARQFVGVSNSTAAPTNVEPSTLTNCIGVGHGTADTNLKIFFGGASAGTPVDLGASYPANTLSVDMYELIIYCPVQGGATWRMTRLNTGAMATGTLTSGQIPTSTTALTPLQAWRSNNATARAVGLDVCLVYFEAD